MRNAVAIVAVLGIIVPSFGQIFCIDACSGGQCETFEFGVSCDLDAAENCCEPTDPPGPIPPRDPALAQLEDDCQLCGCFSLNGPGDGIVSRINKERVYQSPLIETSSLQIGAITQVKRNPSVSNFALQTHDPPLYYLTHALLI
jgi:hypothetical protein